jgi:hypothetical protein
VEEDPQVKQASMRHVMTLQQRSPFVTNINHTWLSMFFTKQHHFVGGAKFGKDWANQLGHF